MSMMPFDLGDGRRRYLDVAEEILKGVATGQIAAGDRLPTERSLAERCGVSRSTVREAVLALELSGVVEVRPGSGCYLTTIGVGSGSQVPLPIDASPREVLEVRQLVEPSVAHLSALARNRGSVERMRRLIDDLLSLNSIEMNEHIPPSGEVDVVTLVRDAADVLKPLADSERMRIEIGGHETLYAIGDRDELTQVFQNLIHNAIKYGREGGQVRVRFGRSESSVSRDG